MDIKHLSPQNLFSRFVSTFLVILIFQMSHLTGVDLPFEQLFIISLGTVLIFSIMIMLFYMIMVQYLMKKNKPTFLEALLCRYGHWLINLVCLILICLIFKISRPFFVVVMQCFFIEIAVYFVQIMFGTKRRNDYGR